MNIEYNTGDPDYVHCCHVCGKPHDLNEECSSDGLDAARGIALGLLLSVPIWCCLCLVVYLCVR